MATEPVTFAVPADVAFAYLVDPANRPLWQSSLRRVEAVQPTTPQVGQTWIDVTAVGVRPAMETTVFEPSTTWTETGTWRGITAELTLRFAENPTGCSVVAEVAVRGHGMLRPLAPALAAAARLVVPGDLRRAAGLLS